MKTKLVSMFLVVAMVFSVTGCSNEMDENLSKAEPKVEAVSSLKNDLIVLNGTYEAKLPQNTRFKFKKWFRSLVRCVADVGGWVVSGFKGSTFASASNAANVALDSFEEAVSGSTETSALKSAPLENLEPGSIGYIHNKTIMDLYEKYGEAIDTISTAQLLDITQMEFCSLTGDSCLYMSKEDAVRMVDGIVARLDVNKSVSENMEALKDLTDDPQAKEDLELCGVLLEGLQLVDDNDTTYFKEAGELIMKSDLPIERKNNLNSALSVGYASAKLWNAAEPASVE